MSNTRLQQLLNDVSPTRVAREVGCARQAVYRWRDGMSFPQREHAERLIDFFGRERLDFNGCYRADTAAIEHAE
jgi:predicted transcriptional regulator